MVRAKWIPRLEATLSIIHYFETEENSELKNIAGKVHSKGYICSTLIQNIFLDRYMLHQTSPQYELCDKLLFLLLSVHRLKRQTVVVPTGCVQKVGKRFGHNFVVKLYDRANQKSK